TILAAMAFCVPIASMVTIAPSIASRSRSSGMAVISLPLASTARAASTSPASCAKAENNMQGAGAALVLLRPAQGLAVDRHDAGNLRLEACNPRRKGPLQRFWIERPQNPAQGLRRRDAMAKRQKTAQPGKLLLAEHRDLVEILHPAQQPDQHRQQRLIQRVGRHAGNPVILNCLDMIQKIHAQRRASVPAI